MSERILEISEASNEQKSGMQQINIAVTEMDSMTQQNAALVEETASASEEMSNQAQELLNMMKKFKVKGAEIDTYRQKRRLSHSTAHDRDHDLKAHKPEIEADEESVVTPPKAAQRGEDIKKTLHEEGFEEF